MKKTKPNLHSLTEKEHITLIPTPTHTHIHRQQIHELFS